ncbi:MAG: hypothetical protein DRJ35_00600 [Thermoprotei archaeon]|nr:MAG: hypothetical protein DRJ35_00600 [Thermoprotei archaeon]
MVRLIITTSRHSTPPVRRLAKELARVLFSAKKVNRGGMSYIELFELARGMRAKRVVIIGKGIGGNPGRILFMDCTKDKLEFFPFIIHLRGVIFSEVKSFRNPNNIVPVMCYLKEDEVCEEIAFALDIPYLGVFEKEVFSSFDRVMLVEPVKKKNLGYVVKFIEKKGEVGPKLLILRVIFRKIEV